MDFSGHATYGGKRYTDWVVNWVENGKIIGHSPLDYEKEINDILDEKVNDGILIEMKRAGYNLK